MACEYELIESFLDKIVQGDAKDMLKQIPDNSIDCIITSPPYWGLRDYGKETNTIWEDGWYGQLGHEPTLDMYIDHLLEITKELKRVLKPTGVMWWNHGDSYGRFGGHHGGEDRKHAGGKNLWGTLPKQQISVPEKCLNLQNYRLILRMIDEQGWILRNIIIWYKPNHMPSSVKDRFTNAYEPVFMLTKSKKYWFDLDAVRVPHKIDSIKRSARARKSKKLDAKQYSTSYKNEYIGYENLWEKFQRGELRGVHPFGKNPGDVWIITTEPFPDSHFAVFPTKLVKPMIKAGCPQWVCKKCGRARERIVKNPERDYSQDLNTKDKHKWKIKDDKLQTTTQLHRDGGGVYYKGVTVGWTDCGCEAGWDAGIVLDPFCGVGTTCYVARKLNRHYIGIEINPKYVEMAQKRLAKIPARLDKFLKMKGDAHAE